MSDGYHRELLKPLVTNFPKCAFFPAHPAARVVVVSIVHFHSRAHDHFATRDDTVVGYVTIYHRVSADSDIVAQDQATDNLGPRAYVAPIADCRYTTRARIDQRVRAYRRVLEDNAIASQRRPTGYEDTLRPVWQAWARGNPRMPRDRTPGQTLQYVIQNPAGTVTPAASSKPPPQTAQNGPELF